MQEVHRLCHGLNTLHNGLIALGDRGVGSFTCDVKEVIICFSMVSIRYSQRN